MYIHAGWQKSNGILRSTQVFHGNRQLVIVPSNLCLSCKQPCSFVLPIYDRRENKAPSGTVRLQKSLFALLKGSTFTHLCVLNSHAFSKQIHSDCECTLAHCHNLQMPKNRYPWWMSCASCATLCSWSEGAVEHTARHIHQSKERRNGRERNEEIRPKPKKKRKVMCRN